MVYSYSGDIIHNEYLTVATKIDPSLIYVATATSRTTSIDVSFATLKFICLRSGICK